MLEINEKTWKNRLKDEMEKEYFKNLELFLEDEYKKKTIYPDKNEIFASLNLLPLEKVKVVILGQDPYHGAGEAHGLAFSVKEGVKIPPSLRNIIKELQLEYENFLPPQSGELYSWVQEGVLLLNATLTVEKDKANSHSKIGWQIFTDKIIEILNNREKPIVFLLWGNFAISKKNFITNPNHLILESPHPSPLSARRGFFGNNHFLLANEFLEKNGIEKIQWDLNK